MKKILLLAATFFTICAMSYSESAFGIVYDEDFMKAGVAKESLEKAKELMQKTSSDLKLLSLEKQKLEIEVNQLLIEGAEKNLEKLDAIFDRVGDIDSSIYKARIRSQISMYKYISKEQYVKARQVAIERIKKEQSPEQINEKYDNKNKKIN